MLKDSKKRTIVIGDVHGCIDELLMLSSSLSFDKKKDRVIFAGDLVDRGPDSGAVVNFVRDNDFECVVGNHDDKHIRYYKHSNLERQNSKYKNPIFLSEDKKRSYDQLTVGDLEWLSSLPKKIYIEKYNLLIIHAGVMPFGDPLQQSGNVYMFCRFLNEQTHKMMPLSSDYKQPKNSIFWADVYNGDVNIAYGHNVNNYIHPHIVENKKGYKTWGLDTGCVFGGHLSALILEDGKQPFTHTIKALKKYYKK